MGLGSFIGPEERRIDLVLCSFPSYKRSRNFVIYFLPSTRKCFGSLVSPKTFSTMDTNSGSWQTLVVQEDCEKEALVLHTGLYSYKGMPFGFTNAPATFQKSFNVILFSLNVKHTRCASMLLWFTQTQ